ncbi:salivary glue protein Sgs-3-like isoform X1 [Ambystoma mexicanum]|uniref:salivary glue protein Sgs-3-like isoform X1 n=1 Tax=Ambystoma mexicanum TaxID=8296 RepID=UPI0037E720D0
MPHNRKEIMPECIKILQCNKSQLPFGNLTDDLHLFYPPGTDEEGGTQDRGASTSSARKGTRATATPSSKELPATTPSVSHKASSLQGAPAAIVPAVPPATTYVVSTEVVEEAEESLGLPSPTPIGTPSTPAETESLDDACLHDSDLGDSDIGIFADDSAQDEGPTQVPATTQPSTTLPSTTQPSTTLPSTTQPCTTQPCTTQPCTTQPCTTQPCTTLPCTTLPSTTQPSTTQPSTTLPSTTLPSTTGTPATETPFEVCLSRVEARQDEMLQIMRQQVFVGNEAMKAIATAIAGNTAAVETSTSAFRQCMGSLTEALLANIRQVQQPHHGSARGLTIDTSTTSTPSTSVQLSPVRIARWSARRMAMEPPDPKVAKK